MDPIVKDPKDWSDLEVIDGPDIQNADTLVPSPTPKTGMVFEPYSPTKHKPRDNKDGSFSTEIEVTTESPDGKYWNIPALWFKEDGTSVELGEDEAAQFAQRYEAETGKQFPRFDSVDQAVNFAEQRSAAGGASETELAQAPAAPVPIRKPSNDWSDLEVIDDQTAPKEGEKESLSYDDVIADDVRMGKIRDLMSTTRDVKYETAPAEEVMDAFMSQMRWMNTNEAYTAKELFNIMSSDDETKAKYGEAFKVYDEMGSMFSNGDAWNGVLDYGTAVITSPSTWLGLGIGKIAGGLGAKGASKTAQVAAIKAATNQLAAKAVQGGVSKATAMAGTRLAAGGAKAAALGTTTKVATEATKKIIASKLTVASSKAAAKYHIAGVLAAEVPVNTLGDWFYQQTQLETGVQDEYSFLQGGIAAVAGGLGAVPSIGILRHSSNSALSGVDELLTKATKERAKSASKKAAPAVRESLKKAQIDWLKMAKAGVAFEDNTKLKKEVVDWFINPKRSDSFIRILHDAGYNLSFDEESLTAGVLGYAKNMGDDALAEYTEIFSPLGITFGQAMDTLAYTMRESGQYQNTASQAARFFNDLNGVAVSQRTVNKNLEEAAKEAATNPLTGEKIAETDILRYASSTWKKTLVSTPMTTALNVKGWGMARAANQMGDLFIIGGHLGTAGIQALVGNKTGSMKHLAKVKALTQNQVFALGSLVDPFLSHEAFLAMLERAPTKIQKSASGQIFGGIEDFSPARFGLNPDSKIIKGVEGYSNMAQKLSFVHLQDSLTKGVTGMISLDRESRTAFGKGISQLISDGEAFKLTDEMWERTMTRVLRETYSEDLAKGTGVLNKMAGVVQNISNNGIGGFVIPFGKFMNFTVANTYRYSPFSLYSAAKYVAKEGMDETAEEMFARTAVGTSLWAAVTYNEGQKQAEGLQWFEHRKADGSVENVQNTFPQSMFNLIGRVIHNARPAWAGGRGEGGNAELLSELAKQSGPLDAISTAVEFRWLKPMVDMLTDEQFVSDDNSTGREFVNIIAEMAGKVSAGYTRPFDAVNRAVGGISPEAGGGSIADIKQAEGFDKAVLQATRYTSSLFNYLLGEDDGEGNMLMGQPRQSALKEGNVKNPNPVGVMVGSKVEGPAKNINKLLGMVDKPPYLAESFTSGNAEFDAFVNAEITPALEARAKSLLNNKDFMRLSQKEKIAKVDTLISGLQAEIADQLEGRMIGTDNKRMLALRRNYLTLPKQERNKAKAKMGITTKDSRLSEYEIEAIRRYMDVSGELKDLIE